MEDLKPVVAKNIIELRKSMGFTQAELAEKLNYSDKAVSKWERGESLPDIAVLKSVADIFGVTVDFLISDNSHIKKPSLHAALKYKKRNRLIISLLSAVLVFLAATCVYVGFGLYPNKLSFHPLMVYLYAIPAVLIVLLVFNSLWGIKKLNFLIISLLMWSVLLVLYLSLLPVLDIKLIFIIGIPAQIIILLWANLRLK